MRELETAVRVPQYTSAEMYAYAYKGALPRGSGRVQKNVIIIPMNKSTEWWEKAALDRQTYFYPHADGTGARVKGHARAAEPGITTIFRKLYYNPDGHSRQDEWDFVTYFECADEHQVGDRHEALCSLLRNLAGSSQWLERPDLTEVRAVSLDKNKSGRKVVEFTLAVNIKRPRDIDAAAEAAAGAPAAGARKAGATAAATGGDRT